MIKISEENLTAFEQQFKSIIQELNPVIIEKIGEHNFNDRVLLFYFASLIKEMLGNTDDRKIKEAVLTFILDGDRNVKV